MEVSQQQNEDAPVKLTKTTDEATGLVSQVKKACSPSPPLVLIQTVDEQQQQQKQQQEKMVATNNNSMKTTTSASITSQQLALIEATDPTELELVMRLITERFPSVKINFFQKSKDDKAKQLDKNNLTTENGNRRLSASSIRQSIDGSGLLSHMMAIERQESRDSGFWSVSKCSFESMKSLSLTDSHATSSTSPSNNGNVKQQHHIHHQANENKSSSPVESTNSNSKSPSNLVLKSPEVDDHKSNKMEETSTSMELTNSSNQDETSTAMNDDENNNRQNENNVQSKEEATTSTMQRTESAGSSSNKPTMHNWTKWKKGQALRYASSSSNTSQYDATSSLDSNPPTHHHNQPTSHHHLYTANVLCASSSFDSSYASAGAESSSLSMAGHCFNYSNSFDSPAVASAASTLSLNPNHLQTMSSSAIASQWSASTSRLDSIKIGSGSNGVSNNGENKSAQKRRGKLVRDRTIDNADEHLASHHHSHMVNKVNIMMGNANGLRMGGEINRISSSSAKDDNQGVQQQQQQQKDEGVGLLSLSRNGRISPPEKRITKMSVSHQDVGSSETPQFDFSSLSAGSGGGNEMHHMKKKPTLLSSSPHSLVSSRRTSYRSQHDSSSSHSKNSFSSSLSTTPPPACSTPSSSAILPGINERANLGASGSSSLSSSPSPSSSAQQDNNVSPSSSSINPTNLEIYRELQSKLSIGAGTESDEHSDAKIAAQTNLLSIISQFRAAAGNNRPVRSNTEEGNLLNVGNNHTMSSNRNQQLTVNSSSVKQPMCRSSSSPNYPTNPLNHHHHGMNMAYNNPFPTIYSSPVTSNSSTYGLDQQSQANGRFLGGANSLTTSMSASPIYPTPFKSISCSIPITQPPPHAPFNLHHQPHNAAQFNPGFLGYNNSLAAAAAAAAATMPFFNPFNKQLPMPPQPNSYHSRSPAEFSYRENNGNNEAGMMSRPPILNNKPPEIVITESKSENSIAEYDQSQNPAAAAAANFMSLVAANFEHQNMFRDGSGAKNENEVNKFGPSLLLPTEHANSKSPLNIFEDWSNLVNRNIKSPLLDGKQASPGAASATSGSSSSTAAGAKAVKPHVCTSCQKRFARSDMLIRHSRLHSGVRPYRCNRCGQEFSRSDHLNTHLRTHTGEKPYSCPHPKCTYAACRKDMITRHLKVHNKTRISLSFDNASTSASSNVTGLSMDAASSYSFLPHSAAASFDATTTNTTTTTSPIPFSTSCSNSNPSPASNDDYKRLSSDIKNDTNNIS